MWCRWLAEVGVLQALAGEERQVVRGRLLARHVVAADVSPKKVPDC
jgi:hypothetical protein